jgi:hypothetical protein
MIMKGRQVNPQWIDAKPVEDGFWKDRDNRESYMQWLETELGITDSEGWYRELNKKTFQHRRGGGLLANYFRDSPAAALREYRPRVAWQEWRFGSVPQGFWKEKKNRFRYLSWLGKELGFKQLEDWYKLTRKLLEANYGATLLHGYFNGSIINLVREFIPDYDWKEWRFGSVPQGFWKVKKNRMAYLIWLGEQLEFRTVADWLRLSRRHFRENSGAGLLVGYYGDSPIRALSEFMPGYNWRRTGNGKSFELVIFEGTNEMILEGKNHKIKEDRLCAGNGEKAWSCLQQ